MRFVKIIATSIALGAMSISASYADISKARNYYEFSPNVLTAGQPSKEQLETVSADGIEVVINLVPKNESIYNPQQQVILERQGVEHIHVPVNWSRPKTSELTSFLKAMNEVGDRKVLVHCWANARASALVYAHLVLQSPETKVEEFENLKRVWTDVAGYNLDRNKTWQNFLDENVGQAQ
ncbi:MAG: protein tyrosine phosphatase family protein [Lentilitoribacter sp.]